MDSGPDTFRVRNEQLFQALRFPEIAQALERTDPHMRVAEPHQHRRARRRGLVAALQLLARLDQRQRLAGVHPQRFEHRRCQHLAHPALQRQPPIAAARPGRAPRALGPQVHQPPVAQVFELGKEKAPAIAEIGVVGLELVAVIAQRQRLRERAGQRFEPPEMIHPLRVAEEIEPHRRRGALVAIAQDVLRELRRPHRIEKALAELGMG